MTRSLRLLGTLVSRAPLAVLVLLLPIVAEAQFRTIPVEAKRGIIRHVSDAMVTVDGEQARLSPGATIRNRENRFIVPVALPPEGALADYLLGADGQISRVWLLTPEEEARPQPAVPARP